MIKRTLYPETPRTPEKLDNVIITEKMDGANLTILKYNGELFIAQRNSIFNKDEVFGDGNIGYRGLKGWAREHWEWLDKYLNDNTALCGEWMAETAKSYPPEVVHKKFYVFATAKVMPGMNLNDFDYYREHVGDAFGISKEFLDLNWLGFVPTAGRLYKFPDKEELDELYEKYCKYVGGRKVEGFVINVNNMIFKYVRMKNGKIIEYSQTGRKHDN
ncbi:RNA ligase family protein [Faecalibaculum rodentium]|uniref:RNA ligase family protein n=1 Tax=Faecalibaculum rodentium TaxID=1702221 RepID=UPI0023F10B34|nr:RNA ligase family protein [Faecalibaculum rodentium]